MKVNHKMADNIISNESIINDTSQVSIITRCDSTCSTCLVQSDKPKDGEIQEVFGVSFALLLLISLLKYFFNNSNSRKLWAEWFCELSIDTLTIFVTILLAYYYAISSMRQVFILFMSSLIVIVLQTIIRRALLNKYIINAVYRFIAYIVCWALCIITMYIVYGFINPQP